MANNICDSDDMKFCLGGDVFLSIAFWNGLHRAHIRKFRSVPDENRPGKFKVYPSNTGIMLTPENLKMLRPLIPHCLSVLDEKQQQQTLSSSSSVSNLSSECPCNNPVLMVDSDVTQPAKLPLTQCPPITMSTSSSSSAAAAAAAAAAATTNPATASAASGSALPTNLDDLSSSQIFFPDQGNCYSYLKKLNNKKANKIWSLKCKKERL